MTSVKFSVKCIHTCITSIIWSDDQHESLVQDAFNSKKTLVKKNVVSGAGEL